MDLKLRNESDLIRLVSQLASEATDKDIFIDHVWNPKRAIELRLWPRQFDVDEVMADWSEGASYSEIDFWHGITDWHSMVSSMKQPRTWSWKKEALTKVVSLPLLLYALELVYVGSKRPRTDMSSFRSPLSRTIKRADMRDSQVTVDGEVWRVIPVTRYASGMSRGLFYADRPA
ncbi:Hypothetical protein POVR2_LOCUS199 [uncultured virus]|nr:Hypothetical protein POVR2_LOCUS199 [uncultured virus]